MVSPNPCSAQIETDELDGESAIWVREETKYLLEGSFGEI